MTNRVTIVTGSIIVAGSIVLAVLIHRPVINCSYPGGQPPPGCITQDYSMADRVEIVLAGFILGLLIGLGGRLWTHRRNR